MQFGVVPPAVRRLHFADATLQSLDASAVSAASHGGGAPERVVQRIADGFQRETNRVLEDAYQSIDEAHDVLRGEAADPQKEAVARCAAGIMLQRDPSLAAPPSMYLVLNLLNAVLFCRDELVEAYPSATAAPSAELVALLLHIACANCHPQRTLLMDEALRDREAWEPVIRFHFDAVGQEVAAAHHHATLLTRRCLGHWRARTHRAQAQRRPRSVRTPTRKVGVPRSPSVESSARSATRLNTSVRARAKAKPARPASPRKPANQGRVPVIVAAARQRPVASRKALPPAVASPGLARVREALGLPASPGTPDPPAGSGQLPPAAEAPPQEVSLMLLKDLRALLGTHRMDPAGALSPSPSRPAAGAASPGAQRLLERVAAWPGTPQQGTVDASLSSGAGTQSERVTGRAGGVPHVDVPQEASVDLSLGSGAAMHAKESVAGRAWQAEGAADASLGSGADAGTQAMDVRAAWAGGDAPQARRGHVSLGSGDDGGTRHAEVPEDDPSSPTFMDALIPRGKVGGRSPDSPGGDPPASEYSPVMLDTVLTSALRRDTHSTPRVHGGPASDATGTAVPSTGTYHTRPPFSDEFTSGPRRADIQGGGADRQQTQPVIPDLEALRPAEEMRPPTHAAAVAESEAALPPPGTVPQVPIAAAADPPAMALYAAPVDEAVPTPPVLFTPVRQAQRGAAPAYADRCTLPDASPPSLTFPCAALTGRDARHVSSSPAPSLQHTLATATTTSVGDTMEEELVHYSPLRGSRGASPVLATTPRRAVGTRPALIVPNGPARRAHRRSSSLQFVSVSPAQPPPAASPEPARSRPEVALSAPASELSELSPQPQSQPAPLMVDMEATGASVATVTRSRGYGGPQPAWGPVGMSPLAHSCSTGRHKAYPYSSLFGSACGGRRLAAKVLVPGSGTEADEECTAPSVLSEGGHLHNSAGSSVVHAAHAGATTATNVSWRAHGARTARSSLGSVAAEGSVLRVEDLGGASRGDSAYVCSGLDVITLDRVAQHEGAALHITRRLAAREVRCCFSTWRARYAAAAAARDAATCQVQNHAMRRAWRVWGREVGIRATEAKRRDVWSMRKALHAWRQRYCEQRLQVLRDARVARVAFDAWASAHYAARQLTFRAREVAKMLRWRRMRSALMAWRAGVGAQKRERRLTGRLLVLWRRLAKAEACRRAAAWRDRGRLFVVWRLAALEQRTRAARRRQCFDLWRARAHVRRGVVARAWVEWRRRHAQQVYAASMEAVATAADRQRRLRAVFWQWAAAAQHAAQQAMNVAAFRRAARERARASAFAVWRRGFALRELQHAFEQRRAQRSLQDVFGGWALRWQRAAAEREQVVAFRAASAAAAMRRMFGQWCVLHSRRCAARRVRHVSAQTAQAAVFATWRQAVRRRSEAHAAAAVLQQRRVERVFWRWRGAAWEQQASQEARRAHVIRLGTAALRAWGAYTRLACGMAAKAERVAERRAVRLRRQAFWLWRDEAWLRESLQLAAVHCRARAKLRCLRAWRAAAATPPALRVLEDRLLLRRGLRRWFTAFRVRRTVALNTQRLQGSLLHSAFARWRVAQRERWAAAAARANLRARQRQTQRHILRHWHHAARRVKTLSQRVAQSTCEFNLQKRAFAHWTAAKYRIAHTEHMMHAAATLERRLLSSRFFLRWKLQHEVRARIPPWQKRLARQGRAPRFWGTPRREEDVVPS